jgi:hypothetical protein
MSKGTIILLLCIGCILCLILPSLLPCILIGTAIYLYFCLPAGKLANNKETIDLEEEDDDKDFEDPTAEIYKKQVDEMFKPGFQDNPEWQKKAAEVKKATDEQWAKEEQEQKDEWKDKEDKEADKKIKNMNTRSKGDWWKYA